MCLSLRPDSMVNRTSRNECSPQTEQLTKSQLTDQVALPRREQLTWWRYWPITGHITNKLLLIGGPVLQMPCYRPVPQTTTYREVVTTIWLRNLITPCCYLPPGGGNRLTTHAPILINQIESKCSFLYANLRICNNQPKSFFPTTVKLSKSHVGISSL